MAVPLALSSVPAQTPYVQYVSGSGQTVFPYPFEITQDADLVCLINGAAQPIDGGYTLSGQGTIVGGNLTFTTGQTAGTIITLYRNVQISRITQLAQNGTFFAANFNGEFNNIYLIMQQLQQSLLPGGNQAFALMVPNSNNPAPTTLLTPAAYANKYLSFDGNGNPTPALLTSSGTITTALINSLLTAASVPVINSLLYVQTAAELLAGVTPVVNTPFLPHTLSGVFYPDRYTANTTPGTTDMTSAINNAIAVATAAGGGVVQCLPLAYKITGTITIPDKVELRGCGPLKTSIKPVGTFNAITVHGANASPNWANARRVTMLELDGSGGCIGNGLDIYAAGLRCYFGDLYIHDFTGMGMRIVSSFDHMYERIESRNNTRFGIQCYEKQTLLDGTYEEQSHLRFLDVSSLANNNGVQLSSAAPSTAYLTGETVTQATSGATGTVNYYDIANYNLFLKAVTGTFDTSHVVTGGTSGATMTPNATSGAAQNLTQWDCAGGDNFTFLSIKPSEGYAGIDFSRAASSHVIEQMYFDSLANNTNTAIRILVPSTGIVQVVDIRKLNCFQAAVGVACYGGANINIGTVMMNVSGTPVTVATTATGPIYLLTPRTSYTDANTTSKVYPIENITTYSPILSGGGSPALGNGTLTGECYQHGTKVSLRLLLTLGSTTVMPTSGLGLSLPTTLAVKGGENQLANVIATDADTGPTSYNLTATLNTTTISFPLNGSSGFWSSTTPFTWATGDTLLLTAEYEVS